VLISRGLLDELIAHALEDPENEVCGVIAVESERAEDEQPAESEQQPARALRVLRARNVYESPLRFQIEGGELLKLWNACQEVGDLGGIYHSHVRSPPYPSQTDVNFAAKWPEVEWVIVGLAGEEPEVRSYLIEGGRVREVELERE
jgi:[CysO sulfur-carrier protein]-S-L-cysteine hydrolase